MNSFLKVFLILASVFASVFVIMKAGNIMTKEDIEAFFKSVSALPVFWLGLIFSFLLLSDLVLAVPSATTIALAGFLLGPIYGPTFAVLGTMTAGLLGYYLGLHFGERIIGLILKRDEDVKEMEFSFRNHGFLMILLSRALPILPELTSTLAGINRMNFAKFALAYTLGTLPYTIIIALAGSLSSFENPKPVIFTVIFLNGAMWILWAKFRKKTKQA